MRRAGHTLLGALVLGLVGAAAGQAHVEVAPARDEAAAARGEIVISALNESQSADVTSIAVRLPGNVLQVQVPPVAGWRSRGETAPLSPPLQIGGQTVATRIATVTWTGGRILPGSRGEFRLRVRVRAGSARLGLAFPAVQRYSDGTVVRWIGPSGSEHPAGVLRSALPVIRVTAVPPTAPAVTTEPENAVSDPGGGATGLTVGLIVGALALLGAGAVALAWRRKKYR